MLLRSVFALALLLAVLLNGSPVFANDRYVTTSGTDVTNCFRDAPCATLAVAASAATAGDTIICLSPPVPGSINITKSLTIDCSSVRPVVRDNSYFSNDSAVVAVLINIPVSASDPFRTVRLRGLNIDGDKSLINDSNSRYIDRGIDIWAAAAVYVEDCTINNVNKQGIYDHRTGGQTKLFVKDTVIGGAGGGGIVAVSSAVGITVLDNVTSVNNAYGIAVGAGNNVTIKNSVFSGNSVAGVEADSGAQLVLSGSAVTHNNIGVQSASSVRLSNDVIEFNNTAISGVAATFGNNSFSGNLSPGTTPTLLGRQ